MPSVHKRSVINWTFQCQIGRHVWTVPLVEREKVIDFSALLIPLLASLPVDNKELTASKVVKRGGKAAEAQVSLDHDQLLSLSHAYVLLFSPRVPHFFSRAKRAN